MRAVDDGLRQRIRLGELAGGAARFAGRERAVAPTARCWPKRATIGCRASGRRRRSNWRSPARTCGHCSRTCLVWRRPRRPGVRLRTRAERIAQGKPGGLDAGGQPPDAGRAFLVARRIRAGGRRLRAAGLYLHSGRGARRRDRRDARRRRLPGNSSACMCRRRRASISAADGPTRRRFVSTGAARCSIARSRSTGPIRLKPRSGASTSP